MTTPATRWVGQPVKQLCEVGGPPRAPVPERLEERRAGKRLHLASSSRPIGESLL